MPGVANAEDAPVEIGTRILVVDDDQAIRELISEFLERHGFAVDTASDGAAMDRLLASKSFDIAVLDVMMPGEDGLSILRRLQGNRTMPIIMLSAVGSDIDRIIGLEMGAEDYLSKPCNPRELLARIRTVLRRVRQAAPSAGPAQQGGQRLGFAGWSVDMDSRLLLDPDNAVVSLTDGEFRLLRAFIEHPRRVLNRDQLLDWSAGRDTESYDRAIDVQVSRLRRKLERGKGVDLIRTVRHEGYMFTPSVEALRG
ncbi:response regulator [Sphingobium phenoxybenzoativorans]|uniref:Regulatory protein VirG n=1 Tax=Sphingobium phenoxybenzoativorans TaxID=1592790 RepID=A0A975K6L9_9SPHN|nr:response regulator [Sphingobium phenoxybenzoativorans]QUT05744.1 response regulator [Sphingobium phenoxybenzoativorans]